jgi:hypothetical protein
MVMKANGTLVVLLLAATSVRAEPVLKFPFFEGERWWVAQGSQVSRTIPNCTHYDGSSLQHSWDFNNFTGDKYRPVLAAAGGTVVTVQAVPSAEGAWGNIIVIDYGGGVYGKVAHLTKMLVRPGQRVRQGEVVGLCGGTPMWFPHIHYENQTGTKANSISVPTETLTPIPTLTTVPSPTPGLIGICHWTSGSKGWNALPVSITNPGHAKHTKDFVYAGPRDASGKPTKDGDAWCNAVE